MGDRSRSREKKDKKEKGGEWKVGEKVLAKFKTWGWYTATIEEALSRNRYKIKWADGDKKDTEKTADEIKARPPTKRDDSPRKKKASRSRSRRRRRTRRRESAAGVRARARERAEVWTRSRIR